MLARHAEDLFWIGRYLERAEDTARLLNVTYHSSLEVSAGASDHEPWTELLSLLYLDEEGEGVDRERIARFVVADRSNPGSIASVVSRARENARGVREWLTLELWEEINAFHLELAAMDLGRALEARPYALCELIRRRCETIVGVATVAMPRTEGYQFMTLGQLLERAGITARLLSVWDTRMADMGDAAGFVEWTKVLRSVGAYEAYLREHHAMFDGSRVIPFLLRARELPRSVLYCLEVAERQLESLSRRVAWPGIAAGHRPGPLAGRVRRPLRPVRRRPWPDPDRAWRSASRSWARPSKRTTSGMPTSACTRTRPSECA